MNERYYFAVQIELLHILIRVADPDESAELRGGLSLGRRGSVGGRFALDGLTAAPPPVTVEVDARRRAEEPFLIAVRFLRHFGVQNDDHHVAVFLQVPHHRLPR